MLIALILLGLIVWAIVIAALTLAGVSFWLALLWGWVGFAAVAGALGLIEWAYQTVIGEQTRRTRS